MSSIIGHVRYSTSLKVTSDSDVLLSEAQPFQTEYFSLVHNGNIPFHIYNRLKEEYSLGNSVNTNSDTELITKLLPKLGNTIEEQLIKFLTVVKGVYCLLLITKNALYVVRDAYGVRPLMICSTPNYIHISSEHSIHYLNAVNQDLKKIEIPPNSIWKISENNIHKVLTRGKTPLKHFCSFEMIYFMDRFTVVYNKTVEEIRFKLGESIGKQEENIPKKENAVVVGCPNTAIPAGKGFAYSTGLPYYQLIHKKKDCGRTFILPSNNQRIEYCSKRIFIEHEKVKGKEVYIIDDSIVRGNTSKSIISKLRQAGATKVHFRVISPPVRNPCHYGIDFPTHEELIGYNKTEKEIGNNIGADSIRYCSLENMKKIMDGGKNTLCSSCFDGIYNEQLMDW